MAKRTNERRPRVALQHGGYLGSGGRAEVAKIEAVPATRADIKAKNMKIDENMQRFNRAMTDDEDAMVRRRAERLRRIRGVE